MDPLSADRQAMAADAGRVFAMSIEILNQLHNLFAVLAVVTTLVWAVLAIGRNRAGALTGATRAVYATAMATTGLAGVTGLITAVLGPFTAMIFPWVGLVIVALHSEAGKRAKLAVTAGGRPVLLVAVQVVVLLAAGFIMVRKPF